MGGKTFAHRAVAQQLRLGNVGVGPLPIELNVTKAGAFNDPTELGNAGILAFRGFVTVFDYRNSRMWLIR